MLIDVGDLIPNLGVTTTSNTTGALADPTALVLTLTLPDRTTKTGTYPAAPGDTLTITRASTGVYSCAYLTTLPGRHKAIWAATGGGADGSYEDAWQVETTLGGIISLEETRTHLRSVTNATDEQLRHLISAASDLCERRTRAWRHRARTLTVDGGSPRIGLVKPTTAVTTVVEDDVTLTATDYELDGPRGRLWRLQSGQAAYWSPGLLNVTITYTAGPADGIVPADITEGLLLLIQHSWDSRRGGSGMPRQGGTDFSYPPGFALPNAVREWWQPWLRRPVG